MIPLIPVQEGLVGLVDGILGPAIRSSLPVFVAVLEEVREDPAGLHVPGGA